MTISIINTFKYFKACFVQVMEKAMLPHSSTLAWKIPWMEELEGCSSWGCWGSDMTEWLHFHFSLSCIGEGNGNPLQCSCLENPRDGGAWWPSMGLHRVGHDWSNLATAAADDSYSREGNSNPLQYSCLENPRDGGAFGLPSMGLHRVGHDWSYLAAEGGEEAQKDCMWAYSSCFIYFFVF